LIFTRLNTDLMDFAFVGGNDLFAIRGEGVAGQEIARVS
jgi:hypothetical protein